ncbi:MAG TPA: sigma-70 family RNA polymerase sigma factor [Thermoanaerobaculia bacterium]|jgi:RNA polymerase sigma-70 factor (ECF subfamily)
MVESAAPTDAALVRAAQRGDVPAFESLYTRYSRVVHGIVLGRMAASDVDDVVQDVFITAYQKLQMLREPAAFAGWIARIARNRAEDSRRGALERMELDRKTAASANQDDAVDAARALAAIRALPIAYRETLMFRLVEGMSADEIAQRTGLTSGSVRVNLHRGMRLLREALGVTDA